MGYVYCYVFPNGKRYVGATTMKYPKKRTGKNGCNYNGKVREAIDLYGWDNIDQHWFPVLDELLDDTERSVIQWLRTTDPDYGYNYQSGGKKGFASTHSEETRRNISESLIGHSVSEETRKKLSEAQKGKRLSEETRRKQSESHKGDNNPLYGKQHSEESRIKMSEARKLYWAKKKGLI